MFSKHPCQGVSGICRAVLAGLALLFVLPAPAFADIDSAGNVIAARRDAWAERGRTKPQLYSKSPVFTGDRLSTNPLGRLQVLFNDDSVLMLAPDSQATISEYVYAGETGNSFNINLAKGVTKLISGRMVENEPGSMRVETPEITVGIQGTSLAVQSDGGISKVTVLHATPGKPTIVYCGEDQRQTRLEVSGTVLIMNAEAQCVPEIRRITPDEQFFLSSLTLPLGGASVSQTAAPNSPAQGQEVGPIIEIAQLPQALQQSDGGSIIQPNIPQPAASGFAGNYSGSLSGVGPSMGDTLSGSFNMGVADLTGKGTITSFSGAMDHYSGGSLIMSDAIRFGTEPGSMNPGAAIGADGSFNFRGRDFDVSNGLDFQYNMSPRPSPGSGYIEFDGAINGKNVDFTWQVGDGTPSPPPYGNGSGSGTKQ